MSKYAKYKSKRNLVGRYIYFRMTKKQLAASTIVDLTPYKNYKVLTGHSNTFTILDDNYDAITIYLPNCSHLKKGIGWHVRHPNAGELCNG